MLFEFAVLVSNNRSIAATSAWSRWTHRKYCWASSSVERHTTCARPKTRTSRPWVSRASCLISAIWRLAVSRSCSEAKIRSLCVAAKFRPGPLVPAFINTG